MGNRDNDNGFRQDDRAVDDDVVAEEALEWFVRLRNFVLDAETEREFALWLRSSPRREEEFRSLEAIWGSRSFVDAVKSLRVETVTHRSRVRRWTVGMVAAAASVLLAVGAWQYPSLSIALQADYVTATGGQSTISLPDGSTMMLNTASAVAVDFEGDLRSVQLLRGEAFFDVQPDTRRPFVVTAKFGEVKVLGTAFSVRTDDNADDVTLERGKVEVICFCDRSNQAELQPGEAVSISASALSGVRSQDTAASLAWREGRIVFENAKFGTVLTELRRYYNGTIVVIDDRVNRLAVTGNYRLDNIAGGLQTLADVAGVKITRIPGGLIILR